MQIVKTPLFLLLGTLFFSFYTIEAIAQPLIRTNTHSKLGKLNNCIHFSSPKKIKHLEEVFTFQQLFDLIESNQAEVDRLIKEKNYTIDSLEIEYDTLMQPTTRVQYAYIHTEDIKKTLQIRKTCMGKLNHPEETNACIKDTNFYWRNPLILKSYEISEYNSYKNLFLTNFKDFKLVNCERRSTHKAKYYLVEEIYRNNKYEVSFRLYCRKVKEQADGFHCKQGYYFEIDIAYPPEYHKKK